MDFDKEFKEFLQGDDPIPIHPETSDGLDADVESGLQELAERMSRYYTMLKEKGIDEDTVSVLCMQYQSFLLAYNTMRHG